MMMNSDSLLLDSIYRITGGGLENFTPRTPDFIQKQFNFYFINISQIVSFWKKDGKIQVPFEQAMEDMVTGLYGQKTEWAFLIFSAKENIKIFLGALNPSDIQVLKSIMIGVFPGIQLSDSTISDSPRLSSFNSCAQIFGCPSGKIHTEHNLAASDQIERLCRGLFGSRWAYFVKAVPIDVPDIAQQSHDLMHEMRSTKEKYLLKGSAIDEHNDLARSYLDLLEAKLNRLKAGRMLGMWQVYSYFLSDNSPITNRGATLLASAFSGEKSLPDPLRVRHCAANAPESKFEVMTSKELSILSSLPREEYPGFPIVEPATFGSDIPMIENQGKMIYIGDVIFNSQKTAIRWALPLNDFARHGLIAGMTGSGKTNTCFQLLDQIWDNGNGIPFIVIESAKSEYRSMLSNPRFQSLRIFTLGDETVSPFRLNPFEFPEGILVQTHIDHLKALFAAAFVLYPPMPYVLEQSIHEVYEDRGWNLASNVNWRGNNSDRIFPTLQDLYNKVGEVIERMGYDTEITMNVRSGLHARIGQLRIGGGKGVMLDTRMSIPIEELLDFPCILELKQLKNDDEKAFIIGLMLIRIYEYRERSSRPINSGLLHVTLIEEAHRLLRNTSIEQGSEISANPRGHAIEVFSNILSEVRALGEGILIAEQIPTKLTPDVIKNTNLKIVHRLVAEDDRKAIGTTMNLDDSQSRFLARMKSGIAIIYAEGINNPIMLAIPLSEQKKKDLTISDQIISESMAEYWLLHRQNRIRFKSCYRCERAGTVGCFHHEENLLFDREVRFAFIIVCNAISSGLASALESYLDFAAILEKKLMHSSSDDLFCMASQLIEYILEQKGAFYSWRHSCIDELIDSAAAIIWELAHWGGKKELQTACQTAQETYSAMLLKQAQKYQGPFAACDLCQVRCQLRYEVVKLGQDFFEIANDFQEAFQQPAMTMNDLALMGWIAAKKIVREEELDVRKDVAYCFALHQFEALGLSSREQNNVARMIKLALEEIRGSEL